MKNPTIEYFVEMAQFAIDKGLKIVTGSYGICLNKNGYFQQRSDCKVCAIGAVLHGQKSVENHGVMGTAEHNFGWSPKYADGFLGGFDNPEKDYSLDEDDDNKKGHLFGQEVHKAILAAGIPIIREF